MQKFKELMDRKKKEGKVISDPIEAAAHSSVLGNLMNEMDSSGRDKVKGIKKVTVASNSPQGLEEGLDKAKQIATQKYAKGGMVQDKILKEGEKEIGGGDEAENNLLDHELSENPEYDDQEGEEAQDDAPENHIHEAEHNDKMSMHTENPQRKYAQGGMVSQKPYGADHESQMTGEHSNPSNDTTEDPEHQSYNSPDAHERAEHLAKENAHLKMLIEQLKAPKSYY